MGKVAVYFQLLLSAIARSACAIYLMGNFHKADKLPIMIIPLVLISACMGYGMNTKSDFKVTVNGNELNKKERKRCCVKAYFYTSFIVMNALFLACVLLNRDDLPDPQDSLVFFVYFAWAATAILDICIIRTKKMKYICKDYSKS